MTSPTFLDIEVMARTLWGEARGEGKAGMEAAASVIMNRVRDRRWPSTIILVCQQPWQFSAWNKNDPNLPKLLSVGLEDEWFRLAYAVAARAVADDVQDRTSGANHYLADWLFKSKPPKWADPDKVTCRMGRHVFLRL